MTLVRNGSFEIRNSAAPGIRPPPFPLSGALRPITLSVGNFFDSIVPGRSCCFACACPGAYQSTWCDAVYLKCEFCSYSHFPTTAAMRWQRHCIHPVQVCGCTGACSEPGCLDRCVLAFSAAAKGTVIAFQTRLSRRYSVPSWHSSWLLPITLMLGPPNASSRSVFLLSRTFGRANFKEPLSVNTVTRCQDTTMQLFD